MNAAENPVVIASNRGPLSFTDTGGGLVGTRGGGGLVSGLAPLLETGQATWIAAALSDADRSATVDGVATAAGLEVRMLSLDESDQRRYYDEVSNSTLWFVHHGLFDLTRTPSYDRSWWEAWDAYVRVNDAFAAAVIEHAPRNATVLVQDYHLTLVARRARRERDDLRFVHFHHTPFAGPDGSRVLPPAARREMLEGLASNDACGFHIPAWERNYRSTQRMFGSDEGATFTSTLNSDLGSLTETVQSPACAEALSRIDGFVGDCRVIARVDRMELSKNIVRGFEAFNRLLETRSDLRGQVVFLACCYPSRLGVPEYARYRDEVREAAAVVNERWGSDDWTPVSLMEDDDFPRSVAVLRRYDVLLVNPIRDGLNLVAKEGPAVNERDGQLVLSTEAGAWAELDSAADGVFPFDVEDTAVALAAALDREPEERTFRAAELRRLATARTPADWLADQLGAV